MSKKQKNNKTGEIAFVTVLVLTLIINVGLIVFEGHANLYFGQGEMVIEKADGTENWDSEYYSMDYDSAEALEVAAAELVQDIAYEGFVLLKNNGTLPLAENSKLTLLGRGSADPVYGGSGSGAASTEGLIDIKKGLENSGFEINEAVYAVLAEYSAYELNGSKKEYTNPKSQIVMDNPKESSYNSGEMPVENYTEDSIASFKDYSDAAVITISRPAGEGGDLSQDVEDWEEYYEDGQHQLELTYEEKQAIDLAKANFENVIVLINSCAAMELGELEADDEIDAILWIGFPGKTGFNSVGPILDGSVTPSGHTVDIYPSDFTQDPTFDNFGDFEYSNISKKNAVNKTTFVQYEEGIYVGYRYYETAAVEGFIDYDEAVVYPFGYGLSYTTFDWEVQKETLGSIKEDIKLEVKVTNTGDYSGKEVLQVYFSAPYYDGGIEKAEVVLADFTKTKLLVPGESEVVTLSFLVEDMASYDYKTEKAYVLDEGEYEIRVQTDSHNIKERTEPILYNVSKTIVYDESNPRLSDDIAATNQFDDVSALFTDTKTEGYALNMSRSDFEGTFPTRPMAVDKKASDEMIAGYQTYVAADNEDPDAQMPTTGADNGLLLIDLRGKDFNDPSWDVLLDQVETEEVVNVVLDGAYTSLEIPSVAKPKTIDIDGPAGLSSFMGTEIKGTAYPAEVVIASTYNTELGKEIGLMVGNEAIEKGVNGWYAPALNVHRSPFSGRNFEYYSEDPLLSGKITQAVIEGAADKGLYTYIKHFALNDQETNRVNNGVSSWANEQAIREIYLKGFEKAIKNATTTIKYIGDNNGTIMEKDIQAATAIMSSFNRIGTTWAGGSIALMENVLRQEWGFEGVAISDFNLYDYMYADQGLAAGTDYFITFSAMKSLEDTMSATAATYLRRTAHRLLYTVVNSNAMNGIVPGTTIIFKMATWKKIQIIADIMIGIFLIVLGLMLFKKRKA